MRNGSKRLAIGERLFVRLTGLMSRAGLIAYAVEPEPTGAPAGAAGAQPGEGTAGTTPAESVTPATDPTKGGTFLAEGTPEGEQKPAEATGAPEAYESFKVPEGVKLDEALMGEFSAAFKGMNLSQDGAQQVVDMGVKLQQKWAADQTAQLTALRSDWANQVKTDKEIGGDKLPQNLAVAEKALGKFGSPELSSLLKGTGLANHPEVIRLFLKVGQTIADDSIVPSNGRASATPSRFFDKSNMTV